MTGIRAIVFDLDGTLVDSVRAHVEAWLDALRMLGIGKAREEVEPLMGLPALKIAEVLCGGCAEALAALKNRLFVEKYIARVSLYPDANVVAGLGIGKAVVTSSSGHVAREVLKRVGLAQHFAVVVGGDEVARGKPDPEPLIRACSMLGVDPRETAVVGDSQYDVEMAIRGGATPICVSRGRRCPDGAITVRSLWELRDLL